MPVQQEIPYMKEVALSDDNKHNVQYFQGSSMKGLYGAIEEWQNQNKRRFLSLSIQRDGDDFCCIALTNPSEVIIFSGAEGEDSQARVFGGRLHIQETPHPSKVIICNGAEGEDSQAHVFGGRLHVQETEKR